MQTLWRRAVPLLTIGALVLTMPGSTLAAAASAPPPTASVTSPTTGSQVAGFVTVTASGQVDASVSDTVSALQLYVDGTYSAQKSCSARSCTASFTWDTTSLYGSHALTVKVKTAASVWATSPAVSVQVGDRPSAAVDAPAGGATVTGTVNVAVSGTVDQLQPDTVKSLSLLVDGTSVGTASCTGDNSDGTSCSGHIAWDSSGLTGQHSLQAKLTTGKGQTGLSAPATVTVNSPQATASLVSPGAVVKGTVRVTVGGAVDASQTDSVKQLALLVDGASVGTASCASGRTCTGTISWTPHNASGGHQLSAQVTTVAGRTGSSAAVPVWVFAGSKVSLSPVATSVAGRPATVTGRVVTDRGAPAAEAKVKVVAVNALGRVSGESTVTTDAQGGFTASWTAQSRTTVTATVLAGTKWTGSTSTGKASVTPAPTCSVKGSVRHGVADPVSCRLGDLSKGTAITLQVLDGRAWKTVVSARTTGATWSTSRVFAAKGTYWVRVAVAASADFTSATTAQLKVSVS